MGKDVMPEETKLSQEDLNDLAELYAISKRTNVGLVQKSDPGGEYIVVDNYSVTQSIKALLGSGSAAGDIEDAFKCPVGYEVLQEPVIIGSGYSLSESALKDLTIDPMNRSVQFKIIGDNEDLLKVRKIFESWGVIIICEEGVEQDLDVVAGKLQTLSTIFKFYNQQADSHKPDDAVSDTTIEADAAAQVDQARIAAAQLVTDAGNEAATAAVCLTFAQENFDSLSQQEHAGIHEDVSVALAIAQSNNDAAIAAVAQANAAINNDSIDREVNNVHSEHDKNISNDWRIIFYLINKFSKKNSQVNKFGTGNLETLKKNGLLENMIKFYNEYYCSDNITVSIISSLKLKKKK